ncbi:MAG: FAD-binding oxidoreductase, partial [Acidimicrobiales bacterium]
VVLAELQRAATQAGWAYGVDIASRDSATVGGMVATNAGGLRALRHGTMREQVAGLELVTADGSVVRRMAGLQRDNAGYDLCGLLCGSEGTLGVVTEVLVRLVPLARTRVTALVGLSSLADALTVVGRLRAGDLGLESAEVMFADGMGHLSELFGLTSPLGREEAVQLLVELTSEEADRAGELTDELARLMAACPEVGGSAVAADPAGRGRLWALRERHPEVVTRLGRPHKLDVAVPLDALPRFEAEVRDALAGAGARVVVYGHAGEGSLHVNVATDPGDGDGSDDDGWVEETVFGLVGKLGGSVSAEHGIGTDKVPWLGCTRSPDELAVLRSIKSALDPRSLLNPGVLVPND